MLSEVYFKRISCPNQIIYLRARGLKPSYQVAKLNEPCENHLPLSRPLLFSE